MHRIKAWLYKTLLTSDPDDYIIRPIFECTLNIKEICKSAVSRGKADISAEAMEHAVNMFLREMGYQLCDGFSINTGWFTAKSQIKGVAKKSTEQYDKKKHTLFFEFHQGALLRKELKNVVVEILGVADTKAVIGEVIDIKTGSVNKLLTPNRNLKVVGYKIKIVGNNVANGIYFVNQTTFERTKVDDSDIAVNTASELIAVIPTLTTGTYLLEITTQYSGGGKVLHTPHTSAFGNVLTVQ